MEPIRLNAGSLPRVWREVLEQVGPLMARHLKEGWPEIVPIKPRALSVNFVPWDDAARAFCAEPRRVARIEECLLKTTGEKWSVRVQIPGVAVTPPSSDPSPDFVDEPAPDFFDEPAPDFVGGPVPNFVEPKKAAPPGLNNCFFKTENTILHDELRFRSKTEIAIYNELKKRRLLFFPNAGAVIGGEKAMTKEPDFLICLAGRWGILEVMGDNWHTAETAVKDHERARLFKEFGILCIEFFAADECFKSPAAVVDKFLAILAKH
jgi:hypothetical protein